MVRRRGDERGLLTLLFTDIVGSSEVATELGDQRWHRLQARHPAVRKALKQFGGHEVDNAGDGFFAAFEDQADAIRCACEISDGVKGIVAGSGLGFKGAGEVELKVVPDRWRVYVGVG
jgi:class 3 adenylate cyclase